ncbi:transposase [Gemmobacter nanjingensis]
MRFALPDAAACRDRFVRTRWPERVTCPKCGAPSIQTLQTRDIFQCRECR